MDARLTRPGLLAIVLTSSLIWPASAATLYKAIDANGAIVYEACDSVPAGSGGTSGSGPGACISLSDGGPTKNESLG